MSMPGIAVDRLGRMVALTLAVAVIGTSLSACGRRGPPEAPPSSKVIKTDEQGNIIEETAPKVDRPFILDPLL